MRTARSSLDLLAAIALALAGLVAALIPLETWLRVVLLAPLVPHWLEAQALSVPAAIADSTTRSAAVATAPRSKSM